ncbi:MAG: DNA replication/repair protein RecF [Bacillota bacterium]|nr:MAG: DNA replication/repair protein RecF [Bacillota bacterium]
MFIRRVVLRDFRSYHRAELDLDPGLIALVGPNAVGKTNLLEAIYFAGTGGSPRTARDTDLIRFGAEACYVRLEWEDPALGKRVIEMACHRRHGKALRIDGRKRQRLADLHGVLPLVYFAPDALALIKHGPALRRAFLDRLLVQLSPRYAAQLQEYHRVLLQRNELLREVRAGRAAASLLEAWDEPLVTRGLEIRRWRRKILQRLAPLVDAAARDLGGGGDPVALMYRLGDEGGEGTEETGVATEGSPPALERLRPQEIARGVTLWGPQRDDFQILIGGRDARAYASQGQQRSLVLALKLAEVTLLRELTGRTPVLLLDDVLSELDHQRRERLLASVTACDQVLLTATEPPDAAARVIRLPLDAARSAATVAGDGTGGREGTA